MQIILTQNIPNLGKKGDLKNVNAGYFRNFLLPRRLALIATEDLIIKSKMKQEKETMKLKEIGKKASEIKEKLEKIQITLKRKATAKDKLYAAIKEEDIIEALEKAINISLKKENIDLKEQIKTLGEHKVNIRLTDKINIEINLNIEKSEK